ncbi:MAG TPA: DUF1343 domain-containing protein [Candidatus Hydrogenedentes bacterium]|nr:DUF1343 domain-containing protein [Candidatus Hydrogenedentota bacterium]
MNEEILRTILKRAVTQAKAPGAVACVGRGDQRQFLGATDYRALVPAPEPATADTVYDLASLTKVVATTTAVMLLRDRGVLQLDQPVSAFIPLPGLNNITLRHLLTHTSGLASWYAWHTELSGRLQYVERIAASPPAAPPGTIRTYSDLGFILLARVVEQAAQDTFDAFCKKHIFSPLGMNDTTFNPPEEMRLRCAPTEQSEWRGRMLRGEVHDDNAFAQGGVSGHAGLFSTVEDLERFCHALMDGRILAPETVEEMTRPGQVPYYPWQGLGWWLDPWTSGANGFLPSRTAIGHTGWTGTCIWMDRANKVYAILLSNTCHPDKSNRNNKELRSRFFTPLAAALYPDSTNAHTGLDKLLQDQFENLRGKRLALLSNTAALDQAGRPILETLALSPALQMHYIYSPEHGFGVTSEAGAAVSSQGGKTPVISLYGERKQPSPEELKNIDLFIVDLPDIGARYYTYMATMKDCMAACAANKVPILVLDRPNPIGGAILEGPIAQDYGSPVCCAPIPVRHGMTLGELALYFKRLFFAETSLQVEVSTAENWWRELQFDACALPWAPPSPNIPTPETALMYIGTCLFEGLNMNEGRGTKTPFLVCGAPWLNPVKVLKQVSEEARAGIVLKPVIYIPKSIPGKASNPDYRDSLCQGITFNITDARLARPFTTAVALICAIHQCHPELKWDPVFDILAGGPWLREQIQAGHDTKDIIEHIQGDLAAFDAQRPRLYASLEERARTQG